MKQKEKIEGPDSYQNVRCHPELEILSIKNFYEISKDDRTLVDDVIEKNFLLPSTSQYLDIGYNFPISQDTTSFFYNLYSKFFILSKELFGNFTITEKNTNNCWVYRSNRNNFKSVWHNHSRTSTINAVYYYQIDNNGIVFKSDSKTRSYLPEQEELIIFPNYLTHKPEVTTSTNWRYSINMEILTEEPFKRLKKNCPLFTQ
jgi:hypothetical protein